MECKYTIWQSCKTHALHRVVQINWSCSLILSFVTHDLNRGRWPSRKRRYALFVDHHMADCQNVDLQIAGHQKVNYYIAGHQNVDFLMSDH
jgi:hypothetical protein